MLPFGRIPWRLCAAFVVAGGVTMRGAPATAPVPAPSRPLTLPDQDDTFPKALWTPSPNFGAGTAAVRKVRWLVIHTTEDPVDKVIARLTDPATRVSVHYLVCRDGRIIQFVRNRDVAYATGNLAYNRASISIEFERYGSLMVTDFQFQSAKPLIDAIIQRYGITRRCLAISAAVAPADPMQESGIIGHANVPDPTNAALGGGANHHTDPVDWNWNRFRTALGR